MKARFAPQLTLVEAAATAPSYLCLSHRGSDAVAAVVGAKYSSDPIALYSDSADAIVDAMSAQSTRRLIATNSFAATS